MALHIAHEIGGLTQALFDNAMNAFATSSTRHDDATRSEESCYARIPHLVLDLVQRVARQARELADAGCDHARQHRDGKVEKAAGRHESHRTVALRIGTGYLLVRTSA